MAHRHDHLTYLELIYYGLEYTNGIRYSNYNRSAERNADKIIRICPKCDRVYEIYCVGHKKYNQYNSSNWTIPVKEGKLLLFPSGLQHSVPNNLSLDTRISLAFNVLIKGDLK